MTNVFPFVGDLKFDFFICTYDGSGNLLTVVYKRGGASGTVVTTLTMTYDGSDNLITATKTT